MRIFKPSLNSAAVVFALAFSSLLPQAQALYSAKTMSNEQWNAAVQVSFSNGGKCSATVIHPNIIVTAAHCKRGTSVPEKIGVSVGTKTVSVAIKNLFKDPDYRDSYATSGDPSEMPNDIMILQTENSLKDIFPGLEIINVVDSLAKTKEILGSGTELAIGYGQTQFDTAREIEGKKRSEEIEVLYHEKQKVLVVNAGNFCYGDSGSGAYALRDGKKYTLGILSGVSGGVKGKCQKKKPAGFVLLSEHVCWIQRVTNTKLDQTSCSN